MSDNQLRPPADWATRRPARAFRFLCEPMARAQWAEQERDEAEARVHALEAALKAAATALWYARVRLGIGADRMRACRAELEADRHQLLDEFDAFVAEASDAEAAARAVLAGERGEAEA